MWILISGPFRSGSKDPKIWNSNLQKLNRVAYEVFKKGHLPIIGVNMALPLVEVKGWDKYDELMMPISLELAARCDAVLRIEGVSVGADEEMEVFVKKGLPVYCNIDDIQDLN